MHSSTSRNAAKISVCSSFDEMAPRLTAYLGFSGDVSSGTLKTVKEQLVEPMETFASTARTGRWCMISPV